MNPNEMHNHEHLIQILESNQRIEQALGGIKDMLRNIIRKEKKQMANFDQIKARLSGLTTKVAKLNDFKTSFQTMLDGLKAERDKAIAERDALAAADAADQGEVDAADASVAAIEATIDAFEAVETGTGGSTGGNTEPQ